MNTNSEGDLINNKISSAKKSRGFWLLLCLALYIVANILSAYAYFINTGYFIQLYPKLNTAIAYLQGAISTVGLLFAYGTLHWKKWGVYGIIAVTVITNIIDVYVFTDLVRLAGGLFFILVFILLVKSKWHYFE